MSTKEDRSGLLTNDDYIDLDFSSEQEDDSLEDISHMQENSLTSCFNFGVDESSSDKLDQSTNQEEAPAETTLAAAQQETLSEVKLEANAKEVLIKEEPGTGSQVITAEFYLKFIEASTGYGKPPLNPKEERDYIRILKENFGKALEPYRTSANTYPFDEEVANSEQRVHSPSH